MTQTGGLLRITLKQTSCWLVSHHSQSHFIPPPPPPQPLSSQRCIESETAAHLKGHLTLFECRQKQMSSRGNKLGSIKWLQHLLCLWSIYTLLCFMGPKKNKDFDFVKMYIKCVNMCWFMWINVKVSYIHIRQWIRIMKNVN